MTLRMRWQHCYLIALVVSMGALFLTQCAAAAIFESPGATSAGLCEHSCPPPSMQTSTTVSLSPQGLLLPWPQPQRRVVDDTDCPVFCLVSRGVSLTRAPPHPRRRRVS